MPTGLPTNEGSPVRTYTRQETNRDDATIPRQDTSARAVLFISRILEVPNKRKQLRPKKSDEILKVNTPSRCIHMLVGQNAVMFGKQHTQKSNQLSKGVCPGFVPKQWWS
jgi:hypothetical protein